MAGFWRLTIFTVHFHTFIVKHPTQNPPHTWAPDTQRYKLNLGVFLHIAWITSLSIVLYLPRKRSILFWGSQRIIFWRGEDRWIRPWTNGRRIQQQHTPIFYSCWKKAKKSIIFLAFFSKTKVKSRFGILRYKALKGLCHDIKVFFNAYNNK